MGISLAWIMSCCLQLTGVHVSTSFHVVRKEGIEQRSGARVEDGGRHRRNLDIFA